MNPIRVPKPKSRTWWFPVQNNMASLSQIHVSLKVFGIVAYTAADRDNCTILVSVSDLMVLVMFTLFRIYGIVNALSSGLWKTLFESEPDVIMYGVGFTIFMHMGWISLTPFYVICQRRRVEAMLQDLKEYDDELDRLGYPRDHQYYHFTITVFLLICLAALGIIVALTYSLRDLNYQADLVVFLGLFNTSSFGYTLYHTELNGVILGIHGRLQLLHKCIVELLESDEWFEHQRQRKVELVIQLAKLYDKLCDAADGINAVFCNPLIILFINVFFVQLTCSFAGLRVLLNRATTQQMVNAALYLSWSLYYNFFVFQTIIYVTALQYQKSKIVAVVHRCINLSHNEPIIERLHQLSEQITSRAPHITFFFFELHPSTIVQIKTLFKYTWDYETEHFRNVLFITLRYLEWIVITRIMALIVNPLGELGWIEGLGLGISFSWLNLGYQTNVVSLLAMLAAIRKRFLVLNKQMRIRVTDKQGPIIDPVQLRTLITKIAILHGQLSDTVDLFNYCHSTTTLFALATAFGYTVFSTFGLIHAYAANVDGSILRLTWANMMFDMFYVSFILSIVLFSVQVNDECKQMAVAVHKAISYRPYDKRICQQLRKVSQQLWHHTPKISCGLFDFDHELIFTIIGSLSTYLVILIQFDFVNFTYATGSDHH